MTIQADILGTDPKDSQTHNAVLLAALNVINYYAFTEIYPEDEPINLKAKEFLEAASTRPYYWQWLKTKSYLLECQTMLEKPFSYVAAVRDRFLALGREVLKFYE